jgi:hypothetical protein
MKAPIALSLALLLWAADGSAACSLSWDCGGNSQCAGAMGAYRGTRSDEVTYGECERVRRQTIPGGGQVSSSCSCDGSDSGSDGGRQVSSPRLLGLSGALFGGLICSFPGVCLLGVMQGILGGGAAGWVIGTALDGD